MSSNSANFFFDLPIAFASAIKSLFERSPPTSKGHNVEFVAGPEEATLPKKSKMNKEFLFKLDEARMMAGTPFKITSGYRTEAHNKKVGGVKGSSHTKGCAVDIAVNSGLQRSAIVCALAKVGF